jgi:hypothetical protein
MNDSVPLTARQEQKLERLLKRSFEPGQSLSPEFESRVMDSIQHQQQVTNHGRRILVIMMLYWALASLLGASLLAGDLPSAMDGKAPVVILALSVMIGASAVFLVHQSRLKLSDLFLGTIR